MIYGYNLGRERLHVIDLKEQKSDAFENLGFKGAKPPEVNTLGGHTLAEIFAISQLTAVIPCKAHGNQEQNRIIGNIARSSVWMNILS